MSHIFLPLPLLLLTVIFSLSLSTLATAIQKDEVRPKAILTQDPDQRLLRYPTSLFFDQETDDVYVTDGGNSQLVLFNQDGYPTGSVGKGRGLSNIISSMRHEGMLYVCCGSNRDFPSGKIDILNNAFFPEQQLVLTGKLPNQETFIAKQIMAGKDGTFYVLRSNNSDISIFDNEWNFLRRIGPHHEHLGVREPATIVAMAQDHSGTMYFLSEQWGRVFVYDENETFLFSFGDKGGDRGKLARARGITVDSRKKRIYIVDYLRHTVLVYNLKGQWLYEIGGKGSRAGSFFYPSAVCTDNDGNLYVADTFNHRVQIFSIAAQ